MSNQLKDRYKRVFEQLSGLLTKTDNQTARMATIAAVLHHKMPHFFWTGFYIFDNSQLVVNAYQGPLACQILEKGKGVCWACILQKKSIIIPNVHEFPGHISCDSRSSSEIVIPVFNKKKDVWAVLDIDSQKLDAFNITDKEWLEKITTLI